MKARVSDTEYFKQEHRGHDMSHGYSLPPKFLDDWATKTNFYGDMRTLWDGKTRTWKLGSKRVDNQGRTVSRAALKDIAQQVQDAEFLARATMGRHGASLAGLGVPADLALRYAKGNLEPITQSPGATFDKTVLKTIQAAHARGSKGVVDGGQDYGDTNQIPAQAALNTFNY